MKQDDTYLQYMPQQPSEVEKAYASFVKTQRHITTPAGRALASYQRLRSDIETAINDFLANVDPAEALLPCNPVAFVPHRRTLDTYGPVDADRAIREQQMARAEGLPRRKKTSVLDLLSPEDRAKLPLSNSESPPL
jgi:hypothetical protein